MNKLFFFIAFSLSLSLFPSLLLSVVITGTYGEERKEWSLSDGDGEISGVHLL